MNRETNILRDLSSAASGERIPHVDVRDEVLRRIADEQTDTVLWVFSGLSAAAAGFVAILALRIVLERLGEVPSLAQPLLGIVP